MINFDRLESQYYTEPFEPYIYTGICFKCLSLEETNDHPVKSRQTAEGKEIGNKLYVRLVCPINPAHNSKWTYHGKRPLKFRLKKMLKRLKIKW